MTLVVLHLYKVDYTILAADVYSCIDFAHGNQKNSDLWLLLNDSIDKT